MRAPASFCAAFVLAGCAGGMPYREFAAAAVPVAGDAARLLVFRVGDTPQYAVRSAGLVIDGVVHAGLGPGQF